MKVDCYPIEHRRFNLCGVIPREGVERKASAKATIKVANPGDPERGS